MKVKKIIASILTFMMLFMNVPTNVFAETKGEAIPVDITLVLDVSGSMSITLNDGKTRMDVLKDFVYNLIDEFSSKNANITDVNKQNRISIVKFAGNKSDNVGNEYNGYANYTQVVSDYVAVQATNKDDLKTKVNNIKAGGVTNTPAAMELTEKLVNSSVTDANRKNAKRVVVFVTDGVPSIGGAGFEEDTANSTISTAKSIKKNAYIYSVGLSRDTDSTIEGDNGDGNWTTKEKFNAYLHGISSNYPDATAYDKLGERLNGADYYKGVKSSSEIAGAFNEITRLLSDMLFDLADYTKVNEAKAKVPSDLSLYTEETVKTLKDALNAVEEGKNITEQTTVDGYAEAINKAINNLVLKDADYTKVNEAKAKVPSNLSLYTEETVKTLKDALALAEEGKNITDQTTVDGYAEAINKAINNLVLKDADYTKVNEAKAKVPSDLSVYTEETVKALKDALALVEEGKNITEQATVDSYADAINKAISNLVLKNNSSTKQEAVTPTVKTENKTETKKVKTGDDLFVGGFAFLLVSSLIGMSYLRKKASE